MSGGINSPYINILNNITSNDPNKEFINNGDAKNIDEVVITSIPKPLKGKNMDIILPGKTENDLKIPEIGDEIRLNNYSQTYTTGEDKVHFYKFADPLTLNFKVIIDYDKKSGLFADESTGKDSALAYLKRIGEYQRYDMLKHWIQVFKSLVKDFDFLFLDIDGLDVVQNKPNHEFFLDKEKIKITFRETTDMLIQSLLTTYNHIVYDKIRKVSVLPSNLRKFDCYVVVFSAGYYNILFHDTNNNTSNLDDKVLPTKRKLSDEIFNINTINNFNHTLYEFVSCSIDPDSGSMYTDNISNEMSSDYVKNNLTFTYKFATFSGTYNNIMGDENWYSILAQASAENKLQNLARLQYVNNVKNNNIIPNENLFSKENLSKILDNTVIDKKLLDNISSFGKIDTYKNIFKGIKTNTIEKLKDKAINQLPSKLLGPHSVIGQTLQKFNPETVKNMIQNTVDLGISKLQDIVDDGITNVNNLILHNYNDNLVDAYKNVFDKYVKNEIKIVETKETKPYFDSNPNNIYNDTNQYIRPENPNIDENMNKNKFVKGRNGISFFDNSDKNFNKNSENIYIRKGF